MTTHILASALKSSSSMHKHRKNDLLSAPQQIQTIHSRLNVNISGGIMLVLAQVSACVASLILSLLLFFCVESLVMDLGENYLNLSFLLIIGASLVYALASVCVHILNHHRARQAGAILAEVLYPDVLNPAPYDASTQKAFDKVTSFYQNGGGLVMLSILFSALHVGIIYMISSTLAAVTLSALPVFLMLGYYTLKYEQGMIHTANTLRDGLTPSPHQTYNSFLETMYLMLNFNFLWEGARRVIFSLSSLAKIVVVLILAYVGSRLIGFESFNSSNVLFSGPISFGGLVSVLFSAWFTLTQFSSLPRQFTRKYEALNALQENLTRTALSANQNVEHMHETHNVVQKPALKIVA